MSRDNDCDNVNEERTSIQAGWSAEEKEIRRRIASNKQLHLKELMFLTALASQRITLPASSVSSPVLA